MMDNTPLCVLQLSTVSNLAVYGPNYCFIDMVDNMPVSVLQLSTVTNLTIYGPNPCRGRAALCSFNVEGLHATDISTLLDQEGNCMQA